MIVNVPFTYRATVLRTGRRKPSTEDFVGLVEIEIPEFSSKDTIEVVSWRRIPTPQFMAQQFHLTTDLGRNYVRYMDGEYYFPVAVHRDVHTAHLPMTAFRPYKPMTDDVFDELRMELERMSGIASHERAAALLRQHLITNKGAIMDETVPPVVDILESNIDERRKAVLHKVESRVAIDGHLWKRVSQPVLVLRRSGETRHLDLHVGDTGYGSPINAITGIYSERPIESPARTMLFHVEELEQAVAFARERALEPRWGVPDFRVDNPDLTSFDRWADIAARTAEFVVHVHSQLIGNMHGDAITKWLEIRDRVTEYRQSGNAAALVSLMEEAIPGFLTTTGPLAGDEVWAEAHECLEIYDRLSQGVEPAMLAGSTLAAG